MTNMKKNVLEEFKNNPKADLIFFNIDNPNRKKRIIKKRKRLHIYNSLNYGSCNTAFRRSSIESKHIRFNTMFGPNAKYNNGSDTMFITQVLKNKLKIYTSPVNIGIVYNRKSTWFKGYNEEFFFNKGALFTAISSRFRIILILQFLLRHREFLEKIKFSKAYKLMLEGSNDYLGSRKGYIK